MSKPITDCLNCERDTFLRLSLKWLLAWVTALAVAWPLSARAVDIQWNFQSGMVGPAGDPDGTLLRTVIAPAVESYWQDVIEDSGTVTITLNYASLGTGLANGTANSVVNGKPTTGTVNIDRSQNWWFDSSPRNNSEYDMTQRLYRDLSSTQQDAWYNGTVPEVVEASYRGWTNSSAPAGAQTGYDIYSSLLHEVGHVLGLSHNNMAKAETVGQGDYAFDVNRDFVRGATIEINAAGTDPSDVNDWAHIAAQSMMCDGCAQPGLRRLPSATDVFAIASAAGWSKIDLPRQDFMAAGSGNTWTAANWEGNQLPGMADDAYIRSRTYNPTVELVADSSARNLYVGEGDHLSTNDNTLTLGDTLTIDGLYTSVYADLNGKIDAAKVIVQNRATLFAEHAPVVATTMTIDEDSFLIGRSGGVAWIRGALVNNGKIYSQAQDGYLMVTGSATNWNLDGTTEHGVLSAASGDLLFNPLVPFNEDFNGTMEVGRGHTIASSQPFDLGNGAKVQLNGGTAAGEEANMNARLNLKGGTARMNVSGKGVVKADFTMPQGGITLADGASLEFQDSFDISNGFISVPSGTAVARFQSDTRLAGGYFSGAGKVELNGATEYAGGSLRTNGVVHQDGAATVTSATTIGGTGKWDLDGRNGDTVWSINDDLTLNTANIDSAGNRFDGELNLHRSGTRLEVNTPDGWTMNGRMNLSAGTRVAGTAPVTLSGALNVASTGIAYIESPAVFAADAVTTVGPSEVLRLKGGGRVRAGAEFQGDGYLWNSSEDLLTLDDGAQLDMYFRNGGRFAVDDLAGAARVDKFTQEASGMWDVQLGQNQVSDRLIAIDTASLGGTLALSFLDGYVPAVGDAFEILLAGSGVSGMFDTITNAGGTTYDWQASYSPFGVTVELAGILNNSPPGDFSGDGIVNGDDLTLLLGSWGKPVTPGMVGWNGNQPTGDFIDGDELSFLLGNWGYGAPGVQPLSLDGLGLHAMPVPEPSTWGMLAAALVCGWFQRRRRENR